MIRFTRDCRLNPRNYATLLGLSCLLAEALVHAVFGLIPAFETLYILPIWIATRIGRKSSGMVLAIVTAVVITLLDARTGQNMLFASFVMRLASYTIVMLLIDRVETAMEQHERLAMTDPLTGLCNRRAFSQRGETALGMAKRRSEKMVVAMIDCNNFKRLNDVRGHHAGDHVLRILARTLEIGTRTTDLVARVGGDEFAIILPDTNQSEALAILNRISGAFESASNHAGYSVTLSFGVSELGEDVRSLESMLSEADTAMYAHKSGQRLQASMT